MKVRLCGLWVQDKEGKKYMAGNFSPTSKLLLFKNDMKKAGSNEPDYILYVAPKEPKQQSSGSAPKDEFMG